MENQENLLEAMTGRRGRKEGRREVRNGGVVEHLSKKKMNRTRAKSQLVTTTNHCKHQGHPGLLGLPMDSSRAALSAQVCQGKLIKSNSSSKEL